MREVKYWLRAPIGAVAIAAAGAFFMAMPASFSLAAPAEDTKLSVVAADGDTAPTSGSPTYNGLDEPMVDEKGNVVFTSSLSNGFAGVFYKPKKKSVRVISSTDVAIPGIGTPDFYDGPVMSSNGIIAFVAGDTTGVSGVTAAVMRRRPHQALKVVAKTGDVAPGTGGAVFDGFDDLSINEHGDVAFIAIYTSDGGSTSKTGAFLARNGGITAVLLNGDTLPGTGGGIFVGTSTGDIDGPWLNEKGDVAFEADFISGATAFEGSLFMKRRGKPLEAFILNGDSVPAPVNGTIDGIHVGRPALSDDGTTIAFTLAVTGGSVENVVGTKRLGGSIKLCAINGDPAPDTIGTIDGPSAASFAGGTVLFHADILGDVSNSGGVFTCPKRGPLREVVLTSDTNPAGTWGNVPEEESLSENWSVFQSDGGTPVAILLTKLPGKEPKHDKN